MKSDKLYISFEFGRFPLCLFGERRRYDINIGDYNLSDNANKSLQEWAVYVEKYRSAYKFKSEQEEIDVDRNAIRMGISATKNVARELLVPVSFVYGIEECKCSSEKARGLEAIVRCNESTFEILLYVKYPKIIHGKYEFIIDKCPLPLYLSEIVLELENSGDVVFVNRGA